MVDYYNKYRNFLKLVNMGDSNIEYNKELALLDFNNTDFTEDVLVNDVVHKVIYKQGKKSQDKKIIFKPNTIVNIGSVVKINGTNYLIIDFLNEGIYEIYPTATIKQCNQTLILPGEMTKTIINYDEYGRPTFKETPGEPIKLPCIVETSFTRGYSTQETINLPEGKVQITIPYSVHKNLILGGEISLYKEQYQITGIDKTKSFNENGLLILHAKLVVSNP